MQPQPVIVRVLAILGTTTWNELVGVVASYNRRAAYYFASAVPGESHRCYRTIEFRQAADTVDEDLAFKWVIAVTEFVRWSHCCYDEQLRHLLGHKGDYDFDTCDMSEVFVSPDILHFFRGKLHKSRIEGILLPKNRCCELIIAQAIEQRARVIQRIEQAHRESNSLSVEQQLSRVLVEGVSLASKTEADLWLPYDEVLFKHDQGSMGGSEAVTDTSP